MKSNQFAYVGGKNSTLRGLQKSFVDSMNVASNPDAEGNDGFSLHVVLSKGDWKYRKEWLEHTRSWSNAAGPSSSARGQGRICPRCFAGQENLPWADSRELFNQADDLRLAAETRCWTAHIEEVLLLTFGVQTSELVSHSL